MKQFRYYIESKTTILICDPLMRQTIIVLHVRVDIFSVFLAATFPIYTIFKRMFYLCVATLVA